ncbi:MAG: NADH-ubiquinone oxidoreductase-F iron-sulfur binding region domain-containing protein [Candidatus Tectimicrobiota bacterium]
MIMHALTRLQEEHGYLPAAELHALARRLHVPLYRLHGVASFYPRFRLQPPPAVEVNICRDLSCWLRGASDLHDIVRTTAEALDIADVQITATSCLGQCDGAPALVINQRCYTDVNAQRIASLLHTAASARTLRRQRLLPGSRGFACNPYAGASTYEALRQLRSTQNPEAILAALKQSGLHGMGGAGLPTGIKWDLVRNAPGTVKYVICNAHESEPGSFKDRVILQHLPDLVLEGMALAAHIVGAQKAMIYLRHEYEREHAILQKTLRQRQHEGILGALELDIVTSPGGYICGEETALLEALQDQRAEPRNTPPFPGTHGLFGQPTLLNNVETFAMVPGIVLKGGAWWAAQGKNGASGLKLLALSGHIRQPGVYEVPLGSTVTELIQLAGGMRHGRALKAFAPGGVSSGFLPASLADTPLEFRSLAALGSMFGSGALVVVAEGTCMLELALNVGRFFRRESCGKCVPCRLGCDKIVLLLEGILQGRGSLADLALIDDLAATMAATSICGLGQAAPNPILSVMQYFRDDIRRYVTG